MSALTLYELPPSPNSIKVRLALGLKKIACERVAIDPRDRAQVVELSGQPLTPVLQDRDRVVYDSFAIMRYLDANWLGEPRLYSAERAQQQEIERWELFGRTQIGQCVGIIFDNAFAEAVDPKEIELANTWLAERVAKIEEALSGQDYLMGSAPNAADLTVVPFVSYSVLDPAAQPDGSIQKFFAEHFKLADGFPKTRAWIPRVLALDVANAG